MDDWLRIVKLFELELSTRKIATQLELPYMTVWKAVMVIRHAIFCHAADANEILLSGEIELDESYFGGRRKGNRREPRGQQDRVKSANKRFLSSSASNLEPPLSARSRWQGSCFWNSDA